MGGSALLLAVLSDEGGLFPRVLTAVLAGVWSFRLGAYLLSHRVGGREEDGRYRSFRSKWGDRAQRNFFILFQAQAVFVVLFSLPFIAAMSAPREGIDSAVLLAVLIWLISVGGEALADQQLARFRSRPENKGKTCRMGLWRYSRHPNYFFEWLHWWTYVALCLGSPYWFLSLIGPVLMFVFLFRLTGIPYTEAQALKSRGVDYEQYQRETSVFFPWFPKSAP